MAVDACRARRPKGKFAKISYLWLKVLLINWTLSCHRMGPLRATCASGCAGAVMAAAVRHPPSPLPHLWYLVYTSNNVKEFNAHIQFTDKTVYPTFQNFLAFLIGLFPASFSWLAEQEHSSMNFFWLQIFWRILSVICWIAETVTLKEENSSICWHSLCAGIWFLCNFTSSLVACRAKHHKLHWKVLYSFAGNLTRSSAAAVSVEQKNLLLSWWIEKYRV